jgi:ComF family protein
MICGICLHHSQPFNIAYALYLYQAPITKLILSLKFSRSLVNAHVLGGLLAEMIKTTWYKDKPFPSIIIPVPLHPKRLKERGFNQALELARPISRLLKIPIDALSCKRIKHTAAQATLSSIERQKNVKNSFKILKQFTTQHIAVLDDVITTGHTIREFCDALKRHGAKTIDVWCCARPK